jgi:hypothetical protein
LKRDKEVQINRSVLFVGDGGNPKVLKRILDGRQIELESRVRPASLSLGKFLRHMQYVRLAAYAVVHRRNYDLIFIWQQYVAVYYFLMSIVYPFHRRPCCVYYIIYKAKAGSLTSWAKRIVLTRMIHSSIIEKCIFLSQHDALYGDIRKGKKIFLNTYTEKSPFIENRMGNESINVCSDFFSGGANNRDYRFLKRLAERMECKRFSLACLPTDLDRISPIPCNMNVACDAYGDAFEELILSAKAVVIPIEDPNVVSGQIVCLRAMQAAKPVFMTKNNFIGEWMPEIASLPFFVMYDDLDGLIDVLDALTDEDLFELGLQAREYYLRHFDEIAFYGGLADIVEAQL